MPDERLISFSAVILGIVGGGMAWRLPASGKLSLALCLIPVAGVALANSFC